MDAPTVHRTPCIVLSLIFFLPVLGQTPAGGLEFEAATVKINKSGDAAPSRDIRGGQIYLRNLTLRFLLAAAYNMQQDQLSGAPGWFDSDHFDVVAKVPPDTKADDRLVMLQNLLKRSFNLVVHQEDRMMPGYALVVSRHGSKLKESESGKLSCTTGTVGMMLHVSCQHATAGDIASLVMKSAQDYLHGGQVMDSTGLNGAWEFSLDWTSARVYDAAASKSDGTNNAPSETSAISFFQALEDQLGLRLESKKIPAPILVIDRVDRVPTEN
jgi:uncharacterized protein (TIGR03435 family)